VIILLPLAILIISNLFESQMADNASQIVPQDLDSSSLRAFSAFLEFPWLNGIVLTQGSLEQKINELIVSKDIPESSMLLVKVYLIAI
jgi:hypothetical protein